MAAGIDPGWYPCGRGSCSWICSADACAVYLSRISGSVRIHGQDCVYHGQSIPQVRTVREVIYPDADRYGVRSAGDHGVPHDRE